MVGANQSAARARCQQAGGGGVVGQMACLAPSAAQLADEFVKWDHVRINCMVRQL